MDLEAASSLIEIPGDIVGTPPYRAQGCVMQGLLLDGDRRKQQDFIDALLVRPSGGRLSFTVLTDRVMLAAVYVDSMGSVTPPDSDKGVIREWDIGFWTSVLGGDASDRTSWRVYWVPSFLFVDTASAMAAGREIFGYPKALARWKRGPVVPEDAAVDLEVLHYPRFGAGERPKEESLVRVRREPAKAGDAAAALDAAFWQRSGLPGELLGDFTGMIPRDLTLEMPQLLMRQVRDAAAPGKPRLQAACALDIRADGFAGGGLLPGRWTVDLTPSASHPIAETLGLARTTTTGIGWWVRQDFTVPAARILWSGP